LERPVQLAGKDSLVVEPDESALVRNAWGEPKSAKLGSTFEDAFRTADKQAPVCNHLICRWFARKTSRPVR
jgi:hypothetical protein